MKKILANTVVVFILFIYFIREQKSWVSNQPETRREHPIKFSVIVLHEKWKREQNLNISENQEKHHTVHCCFLGVFYKKIESPKKPQNMQGGLFYDSLAWKKIDRIQNSRYRKQNMCIWEMELVYLVNKSI